MYSTVTAQGTEPEQGLTRVETGSASLILLCCAHVVTERRRYASLLGWKRLAKGLAAFPVTLRLL